MKTESMTGDYVVFMHPDAIDDMVPTIAEYLREGIEVVTPDEFAKHMKHPCWEQESPLRGKIYKMTYVTIVPPEEP